MLGSFVPRCPNSYRTRGMGYMRLIYTPYGRSCRDRHDRHARPRFGLKRLVCLWMITKEGPYSQASFKNKTYDYPRLTFFDDKTVAMGQESGSRRRLGVSGTMAPALAL